MRILIATDGSEYSRAAIDKCCEMIANPKDAHVKVVSAYEDSYPIAAEPYAVSAEFYQQIINAAELKAVPAATSRDYSQRFSKQVLLPELMHLIEFNPTNDAPLQEAVAQTSVSAR